MRQVQPLLKLLHDIGAQRGGKSVSQVKLSSSPLSGVASVSYRR